MLHRLRNYLMLATAAALATYGLLAWHDSGLSMQGLLLYDNDWRPHPLHLLVIGLGGLPPAMWEIFWQDRGFRKGHPRAAEAERDG